MLALFAEGERLLRVVEAGDIELVIAELPEWQAQVMKMTVHKTPSFPKRIGHRNEILIALICSC